ncbi:leucine--tRNA ligase [Candidatus Dojkabacteria bacterium]|nr:leucine--tRNA ligase [Candidatus Dojkabacteria bacterium]
MKMPYEPTRFEKQWQEKWFEKFDKDAESKLYHGRDFDQRPKKYVLVEFPYPSGAGMHIGHARNYSMMDTYARLHRMLGYNVMYPMGWDAFGLPTENFAIKHKRKPQEVTQENTDNFERQLKKLGLSFDWDRKIDTTDPDYYKWTQWIFLQLYKKGLAYKDEMPINWCPKCKTGCANEEVIDGNHERCGEPVTRKKLKQWMLKITEYADRLADELDLVDYPDSVVASQRNWIGRKEWIDIVYPIVRPEIQPEIQSDSKNSGGAEAVKSASGSVNEETEMKQLENLEITVSTTRPDTNFGATFVVIAPEHPIVEKLMKYMPPKSADQAKDYIKKTAEKTEKERLEEGRKKTGVFTGLFCKNPLTQKAMPIYLADFVMMTVGTGAVVGVPGHDMRDFEFAQEFDLPVIRVVVGDNGDKSEIAKADQVFEGEGRMMNSDFLDGLKTDEAISKIMDYIEKEGWGKRTIRYHLRDWIFSRQHYWGEPIPIIFCDKCGEVPVPEEDLPVVLPEVDSYEPTDTGESPLANISDWVNVKCPKCGGSAQRETDTMPNWAGSSWYFLRYCDPDNDKCLADKKLLDYWMPVDIYDGGAEHTTLHLLYSRFWHKFLNDIGVVPGKEPYAKRRVHGIVLGEGGVKMSKSLGNVINPDDLVNEYGADTARCYLMFMGPYDGTCEWNTRTVKGVRRFLEKFYRIIEAAVEKIMKGKDQNSDSSQGDRKLIVAIAKLSDTIIDDVKGLKFNTAIAALMKFFNEFGDSDFDKTEVEILLKLIAPFAPHLAEELWEKLGNEYSIHSADWPEFKGIDTSEDEVEIPVQINGKVRGTVVAAIKATEDEVRALAEKDENIAKYLQGADVKKVIFVPGKMISFVL